MNRRRVAFGAAGLMVLAAVVLFGFNAFRFYGGPLIDEWSCVDDEIPVVTTEGGAFCAKSGYVPEAGEQIDPLGNRPFECRNRHGWVQLVNDDPDQDVECWEAGRALTPEVEALGWRIDEEALAHRGWFRF